MRMTVPALLLLVALTSCDARPKTEEPDRSVPDPITFCGERYQVGADRVICHAPGVADLSPLTGLPNLTHLDISRTRAVDLSPLASLANLTHLDLSRTRVVDLVPIIRLQHLSSISLDGTQVVSIRPLASIATLTSISMRGAWVVDIIPLVELSMLTHLDVTGSGVSLEQVVVVRHFLPGARVVGP